MGEGWAVAAAFAASLIATGEPPAPDPARLLTGPPAELVARLKGETPGPMPIPTFARAPDKKSADVSEPSMPEAEPPTAGALSAAPADEVGALTVTAAAGELGGPAWWKVSDGDTTVWIMATPDMVPMTTAWDKRALELRMRSARQLIVPGGVGSVVRPAGGFKPEPPPKTNLSQRLPADLYARLAERIEFNDARARYNKKRLEARNGRMGGMIILHLPNEYTSIGLVTARLAATLVLPGELGNPVRAEALRIAQRTNTWISPLGFSAASFTSFRALLNIDPQRQTDCMRMVLNALDAGASPHSRMEEVGAWAVGNVAGALKRADPMNACDYGPQAGSFWGRLVADNVSIIRSAMEKPGEVVAIVEFDPFLAPGGVLDQLEAAGYHITWPRTVTL